VLFSLAYDPLMFCKTCYYALDHLFDQRCPECGRQFDRRDPRTFNPEPSFKFPEWVFWVTLLLTSLLGAATIALLVWREFMAAAEC
jgi:predicted amidophosphoribosyltransferase